MRRNDPCYCGSGKKYKQCCGRLASTGGKSPLSEALKAALQHHQAGRLPQAEALYRQILARVPNHPDALHYLGVIAYQVGQIDNAVELIGKAISTKPFNPIYYNNLGLALQNQGKLEAATASYRKALSCKPDFAEAHYNLGNALQEQGGLEEAVASYRRALSFRQDYAEAYNNLARILQARGKLDEAVTSYRRALSLKPDYAVAHYNLGNALRDQGKADDAIDAYRKALSFNPDDAEACNNLGSVLQGQGRLDAAVTFFRKAIALKPDLAAAHSNLLFALQFCPTVAPAELVTECERFAQRFEAPLKAGWQPHRNLREPGRRLKVGYVSPDFRRHAVAYFIEPVLANHDRDRFEILCYYNHTQHDEVTNRLVGYADRWLDCPRMPDAELSGRIRADGIDILIDLAGHTAGNRMLTFARKPAPIQITYLGCPGASSGLAAMDYRLTDARADPSGTEAYYTEKLLRLPDSQWCYRPDQGMPEVSALPAQRNGYVTFGSFHNFSKIDESCIELWGQLLRAVPTSRLLMMTVPEGESKRQLIDRFAGLGVPMGRLELHGRIPRSEFLRMFQRADIALEPFPITGGTTTCETLWMGLPVIALVGTRCISRMGFSILSAVGLQDFAASTTERYLAVAMDLAGDVPRLAQLRTALRPQVAGSSLAGDARFTRNLEEIYREVWTTWCDSAL